MFIEKMSLYNKEQIIDIITEYIEKNIENLKNLKINKKKDSKQIVNIKTNSEENVKENVKKHIEKIFTRKTCKGITEKQIPCKNNAQPGKEFCKRHDKTIVQKVLPTMTNKICKYIFSKGKKKGKRCNKKRREGFLYCSIHNKSIKTDEEYIDNSHSDTESVISQDTGNSKNSNTDDKISKKTKNLKKNNEFEKMELDNNTSDKEDESHKEDKSKKDDKSDKEDESDKDDKSNKTYESEKDDESNKNYESEKDDETVI